MTVDTVQIQNIAKEIIDNFDPVDKDNKELALSDYKFDNNSFIRLEGFKFNEDKTSAHKELSIKLINGYECLSSDIKKQFKLEFFKGVEKRCPFCGQLLESSGKSNSEVPTADLDHFFPKFKYPQFALNPNNLIPTCMECNRIEKHTKNINPQEFKIALNKLNLLKDFQNHPKSHFKLFKSLDLDLNIDELIKCETSEIKKLINLYGLQERYNNIKNKCYNILNHIIKHSDIQSPESLERLLGNIASSNWHEINDGYSLNNSPQIWQEFIENILYDECKLIALWDEVKQTSLMQS